MKKGIFVALAALAFAVFAVPDAHAWKGHHHGPDVDQRVFGHVFTINVTEGTPETPDTPAIPSLTTSLVTGIAKGQPGKAQVTATLVFETDFLPNGDCPEGFALGSNVVSFEWGETYNDGSLLAGSADPGQLFCLDADIITSIGDLTGTITGGTGRFEGASGTWRIVATSPVGISTATATLTVDFD